MGRIAAKAALGAQESEELMSTTFDADLARANLLRMRAEYRKAEEICIGILKTYPNSAATHTLLGDIYSDQGLLEQAAQWYELSLDLDPSSWSDKQKLEDVREQIKERDHISSVEQLGLPEAHRVTPTWFAVGAAVFLIFAAGFGYAIRYGRLSNSGEMPVIRTPIRAVADNAVSAIVTTDISATKPPTQTQTSIASNSDDQTASGRANEDRALMARVVEKSPVGSHLKDLVQDPRIKLTTLTYAIGDGDDQRTIGAELAKSLLELSPDSQMVTIRAMRDDKLVYMADVPRTKYADTLTDDWQQKAASSDAWISYVLTNEWPYKGAADSTPPSGGTTGDATTPTTAGSTGSTSGTTGGEFQAS